jgi:hypothetical protein
LFAFQDLEERERNLTASQGRAEMAMQTLQRENRYQEEKVKDLEKKVLIVILPPAVHKILVAMHQDICHLNICNFYSIKMCCL